MLSVEILGLGHPRTGTGYTAKLLNDLGITTGHERLRRKDRAIVAWQFISPVGPYPYIYNSRLNISRPNYQYLIYNRRNPRTSIPSIVLTENTKPLSRNFRFNLMGKDYKSLTSIEAAIESLAFFDSTITDMGPDVVYRIEDEYHKMIQFSSDVFGTTTNNVQPKEVVNAREHDSFDLLSKREPVPRPLYQDKINELCTLWGYPTIDFMELPYDS